MSRAFNTDFTTIVSEPMRQIAPFLRIDLTTRMKVLPALPVRAHQWCALATLDPVSKTVFYETVSPKIKETGFDAERKFLHDLDFATLDYFQSAYEHVLLWGEPVFGWETQSARGYKDTTIFEFALFPIGRTEAGKLAILALEDWHGSAAANVPEDYRAT